MQPSRRTFLKQSAAVVAASGAQLESANAATPNAPAYTIPPHAALSLPGLHAYAEKSLHAGETIHFRVSSSVSYQLAICRLGEVDDRGTDQVLHTFESSSPSQQPIHPGSYIHVARGLSLQDIRGGLTMECWVRPWRLDALQGVITQTHGGAEGLALSLTPTGQVEFKMPAEKAAAARHAAGKLAVRRWHHIAATWDGQRKRLYVDGALAGNWPLKYSVAMTAAPLRVGASAHDDVAAHFLDGDVALPVIYGRALTPQEIVKRFETRGLQLPGTQDLLACWPLDEERGKNVHDASTCARHGRIINRGTWMIGGPSFDAASVPRFGDYDPQKDLQRGHALRFASDDLYDCRWDTSHEFTLPKSAPPGVYIGRFRYPLDGQPADYHVAFVVRRATKKALSPILVLCSTNTWLAYGATPFAKNLPPRQSWPTNGLENSHTGAPAYSCYRDHAAGQPAYQLGTQVPWPAAGPDVLYSPPSVGYSHLMRGERFLHRWLEQSGYDYDLAADYDLHREPQLLASRQLLVINGHSEYWSREAYQAVEKFLAGGGNVLVLSGNTMFWRVSYSEDGHVMECRKLGSAIGGSRNCHVGELWHTSDRERGSMMRDCGLAAWRLLGLDCIGWWGTGTKDFGVYRCAAPDHFLFHTPEKVDVDMQNTFGLGAGGNAARAIGHEADVRLAYLRKLNSNPLPRDATLPEEPAGILTLADGIRPGESGLTLDYFGRPTRPLDDVCAHMIYWERPGGGRVFHAGAIAAGWALSADPRMQALLRNVLHHFGIERNEKVSAS